MRQAGQATRRQAAPNVPPTPPTCCTHAPRRARRGVGWTAARHNFRCVAGRGRGQPGRIAPVPTMLRPSAKGDTDFIDTPLRHHNQLYSTPEHTPGQTGMSRKDPRYQAGINYHEAYPVSTMEKESQNQVCGYLHMQQHSHDLCLKPARSQSQTQTHTNTYAQASTHGGNP